MLPLRTAVRASSPTLLALRRGAAPAFHTSARQNAAVAIKDAQASDINTYVPGGPVLPGTVNDATSFPPPSKAHGSHHWQFERLLSVALLPITASSYALSGTSHPALDGLLCASLIVHSHIGFDSCLVDYLHKRKFPVVGPAASWALKAATVAALWGCYEFNTNDIGLTELIRKTWKA